MKAMKEFVKTCYSEDLLTNGGSTDEKQEAQFVIDDSESAASVSVGPDAEPEQKYHGGLGLKFKFPGDPKK